MLRVYQPRPLRRRGVRCSRWRFRRLVLEACDTLPRRFQALLRNVAVTVDDLPPRLVRLEGGALGLYEGTPIGHRGTDYTMALPDKISVYRLPLLAACNSQRELREEVRLTVLHEVGHYFGIDDADLPF
jgi:predicted Zn-dependent protease with MMP-like domain